MVDAQGNFLEKCEVDIKAKEENKKSEDKTEDKDIVKEGGEPEKSAYEGGDS